MELKFASVAQFRLVLVPFRWQDKAAMHRSRSLPMNMKKFNSAKSIKRMNSLGGVYRVVPSTPRDPAAAPSNVVPDIEPTESGGWILLSNIRFYVYSFSLNLILIFGAIMKKFGS
jgi:hypothetical protein